jgi:hypothetical protein
MNPRLLLPGLACAQPRALEMNDVVLAMQPQACSPYDSVRSCVRSFPLVRAGMRGSG